MASREELEAIYCAYRQQLFTCALVITGSTVSAEDAVHSAFCGLMGQQSVIIDTAKKRVLMLDGKAKTARTSILSNTPNADFALLAIEQVRGLDPKSGEPTGLKQVNGVQAKGYRFGKGGDARTLWLDVESNDPVQVEFERGADPDRRMRLTWSNIQIDSPISDQRFELDVPAGFEELVELQVDPSASPGTHFAALMKLYAIR